MNGTTELAGIVDEWLMLVKESGDSHSQAQVTSVMRDAQRTLANLRRRLDMGGRRYVVAAVGLTNVGKSTLLNAVLGSELAPRRNRPCTAAPIEFVHGDRLRVTAHFGATISRPTWSCDSPDDVHRRLSDLACDGASGLGSTIRRVVVDVPLPLLESGLVIADTPGFGAAQAGVANGTHEAALRTYLVEDVSQVFWVVLADQGIGKREKSFHDNFFADVCDDVVVTGSEDWDQDDRARFRERFISLFGTRLPSFHFVSGLAGMRARTAGDAEGLEAAGITHLESRIRDLAEPTGRNAAMAQTLVLLAEDLAYWLSEFRDERRTRLRHWWRLDSWARWKAANPESILKERLTAMLQERDQ